MDKNTKQLQIYTNKFNILEKSLDYEFGSDDWDLYKQTENDLLHVIELQKSYAEQFKSFFIINRLSNQYQLLALEYLHQNSNINTVKYYYIRSIEFDIESIKYANNKHEYNIAIQRITKRYQDILTYCIEEDTYEYKLLQNYIKQLNKYT